jgi:hypothetical protein
VWKSYILATFVTTRRELGHHQRRSSCRDGYADRHASQSPARSAAAGPLPASGVRGAADMGWRLAVLRNHYLGQRPLCLR